MGSGLSKVDHYRLTDTQTDASENIIPGLFYNSWNLNEVNLQRARQSRKNVEREVDCGVDGLDRDIGVDLAGLLGGGRMASAEGGSVSSGVAYGEGVPSPAD